MAPAALQSSPSPREQSNLGRQFREAWLAKCTNLTHLHNRIVGTTEPPNGDELAGRGAAGILGLHLHSIAVLCITNPSTAFCTLHLKPSWRGGGRRSSQLGFPAQAGHLCTTERLSDLENHHEQWVSTAQTTGGALTHRQIGHQGAWGFKGTKTEPDALTPQHQVPTWPLTNIPFCQLHILSFIINLQLVITFSTAQ